MNRERLTPQTYDAWYRTARGAWMGKREAETLARLGGIGTGMSLLDVGCGTGWFSRQFAAAGAAVTGVDRDAEMLAYARVQNGAVHYVRGDMSALPVADKSFDIVAAVTSLCFVREERQALTEMIRVARRCVVLGLLHRYSLLHWQKHGRGAYAGAHWHTRAEIRALIESFPAIRNYEIETLLFWPGGPRLGRVLERLPGLKYFGGFMAIKITL